MNDSISALHIILYLRILFYKLLSVVVTKMSPWYTAHMNNVHIEKMSGDDISPRFCHHFGRGRVKKSYRTKTKNPHKPVFMRVWRKRRDSNPRAACATT